MNARKAPLKPSAQGEHHYGVKPEEFAGKYRLLKLIRRGIESTVHEADVIGTGKKVAIKIPYAHLGESESLRPQFQSAARALSQMGHPNIVQIDDYGVSDDGSPFIVMELLKGETLEMLLSRRGALPPMHACELMVQVLAGLTAAHRVGIVHKSLEPSNIFVTYPEPDVPLVKLLEFGAAKTAVGSKGYETLLGTASYMAPEQARSTDAGPLVDVYAAGVILYELLAGEAPFGGDNGEILKRVVAGQWRPLSSVNPAVPRLLTLAVSAAMATDPGRRIASARVFSKQLAPYLSHAPTHSAPQQGTRSAAEFILGATSALPEIKLMSSSELPDPSRPPRDFPSLQLAKVAGKPRGEPLADSLLQSPIIPRAPTAPRIHISSAIRDVEMWSTAPKANTGDREEDEEDEEDEAEEEVPAPEAKPVSLAEPSGPVVVIGRDHDPVFDSMPSRDPDPVTADVPEWNRGAWAAAFGVGVGAILAWLYRLG
ncbi:MAG TPA: serine/threonine-protein kinase [Polyangiaceae bacterium]|jgi:serine/threonine-protein kinase|nr:serine/threonine-protein kinase [Polyangiaceae bacterium]